MLETIRWEIVVNNVLMHFTTLVVVCSLLAGVAFVERRDSVLSIILPVVSISWAAATARFDYLIQRQGAFIAWVETGTQQHGWELWKAGLTSRIYVMPVLDAIAISAIAVPTVILLFGPATRYWQIRGWPYSRIVRWAVLLLFLALVGSFGAMPLLARI